MRDRNNSSKYKDLEVYYSGKKIGTIHLEEEGIIWRIDDRAVNISGFTGAQLQQFISRLINAPLERRRRRHQAMPHLFQEMRPNSAEHFLALVRDCGPFSVVPLPMP